LTAAPSSTAPLSFALPRQSRPPAITILQLKPSGSVSFALI
jgi:hypothetical protein